MKKLITLAALVAACAPAFTAEVESTNIVGYQKLTVPANAMDIMGVQFQTIGGGGVDLQTVVPAGYSEEGRDWIKIWDPVNRSYTFAYYWGESVDGGVWTGGADDPDAECLGAGWGDGEQVVVDATIADGQGFWTQAVSGGTLTIAGEVASSAITIPANAMTIVTSTYPGEISIQDIVPTGYSEEGRDWIKVWDAANRSYVFAYYWGASVDGGVWTGGADDPDAECLGPGWGDGDQVVVNVTINPGQGFWTQAVSGGSLTFPAVP